VRDRVDVGAAVASRRVDKSVGGRIKVYLYVCVCAYLRIGNTLCARVWPETANKHTPPPHHRAG